MNDLIDDIWSPDFRYWAIHDPINYAQKRTLRFVCLIILLVWIASGLISVPPLLGWNDWSSEKLATHCELTTEKAFVVYSASGSFFVPLLVMLVVYLKIFMSARKRIRLFFLSHLQILLNAFRTNRGRSALVKISKQQRKKEKRKSSSKRSAKTSISLNNSQKLAAAERAPLVEVCSGVTVGIVALKTDSGFQNGEMSSETKNSDETAKPKVSLQQGSVQPSVDPAVLDLLADSKRNGIPTTNLSTPGEQLTTTVLKKREKISVAKEKRAAKTIAVIISVFTICWFPFFVSTVVGAYF